MIKFLMKMILSIFGGVSFVSVFLGVISLLLSDNPESYKFGKIATIVGIIGLALFLKGKKSLEKNKVTKKNRKGKNGKKKKVSPKDKIKFLEGYLTDYEEDEFTKVKTVKFKRKLELSNGITGAYDLKLWLTYRHVKEDDILSLNFLFDGYGTGFPGFESARCYFLADEETIEISEIINKEHDIKRGGGRESHYLELVSFKISVTDFLQLCNAENIKFSFRAKSLTKEGLFDIYMMNVFKGFKNVIFDNDYMRSELYKYFNKYKNDKDKESEERLKKWEAERKAREGCFVATSVYGNYEHPSVVRLRCFRDEYLIKTETGKMFVSLYYKSSPILVKYIDDKEVLKKIIRVYLDALVNKIKGL